MGFDAAKSALQLGALSVEWTGYTTEDFMTSRRAGRFFLAYLFMTGSGVLLVGETGRLAVAAPVAASAAVPADVPSQSAYAAFVPHRAVYDVRLTSSKSGAQILDIKGKMLFSLRKSCDGWITDHRFNMVYEYGDAASAQMQTQFTGFESYDGRSLSFSSARVRDGETYETYRGNAVLDPEHPQLSAVNYTEPPNQKDQLDPKTTLFPMAHALKLIDSAKAGERIVNASVFDGTDDTGPVEINAVIGKSSTATEPAKPGGKGHKIDTALLSGPSWSMRLAVFSAESRDSLADYELTMDVLENGIVRQMNVDYHDFSISQKLVALEKGTTDDCTE